nr:hypothetical protein [Tanacetum cinerariifolium]
MPNQAQRSAFGVPGASSTHSTIDLTSNNDDLSLILFCLDDKSGNQDGQSSFMTNADNKNQSNPLFPYGHCSPMDNNADNNQQQQIAANQQHGIVSLGSDDDDIWSFMSAFDNKRGHQDGRSSSMAKRRHLNPFAFNGEFSNGSMEIITMEDDEPVQKRSSSHPSNSRESSSRAARRQYRAATRSSSMHAVGGSRTSSYNTNNSMHLTQMAAIPRSKPLPTIPILSGIRSSSSTIGNTSGLSNVSASIQRGLDKRMQDQFIKIGFLTASNDNETLIDETCKMPLSMSNAGGNVNLCKTRILKFVKEAHSYRAGNRRYSSRATTISQAIREYDGPWKCSWNGGNIGGVNSTVGGQGSGNEKNKQENDKIRTKPDQIKKKREAWKSAAMSKKNQNSLNDSPSISANSSQNPPHIDERCYECGDALDGIFCQRCTYKSCGKGYNQTQPPQFPDTMCDVHLVNNPTPLEAKDHFEIEELKDNPTPYFEFLTKSSSTSAKSFFEETNTFDNSLPEFENFCFNLEEISSGSTTTHSDISLLNYEPFSFYDDHIEETSSGSTTTPSDISFSEYDSFIFDLSNDQFPPTDRSDSTLEEFADELAHIISPPEYDCFYFGNLPDPGEWISSLNSGIRENLSSTTRVNLTIKDDHSFLLAYVVWIFLAYLMYLVIPPHLYSFKNEDTIFDPSTTINRFYLFKLGLSHRCGTFKKFITHRSHLNESLMEMLFPLSSPRTNEFEELAQRRPSILGRSRGQSSNAGESQGGNLEVPSGSGSGSRGRGSRRQGLRGRGSNITPDNNVNPSLISGSGSGSGSRGLLVRSIGSSRASNMKRMQRNIIGLPRSMPDINHNQMQQQMNLHQASVSTSISSGASRPSVSAANQDDSSRSTDWIDDEFIRSLMS